MAHSEGFPLESVGRIPCGPLQESFFLDDKEKAALLVRDSLWFGVSCSESVGLRDYRDLRFMAIWDEGNQEQEGRRS